MFSKVDISGFLDSFLYRNKKSNDNNVTVYLLKSICTQKYKDEYIKLTNCVFSGESSVDQRWRVDLLKRTRLE